MVEFTWSLAGFRPRLLGLVYKARGSVTKFFFFQMSESAKKAEIRMFTILKQHTQNVLRKEIFTTKNKTKHTANSPVMVFPGEASIPLRILLAYTSAIWRSHLQSFTIIVLPKENVLSFISQQLEAAEKLQIQVEIEYSRLGETSGARTPTYHSKQVPSNVPSGCSGPCLVKLWGCSKDASLPLTMEIPQPLLQVPGPHLSILTRKDFLLHLSSISLTAT